MLRDGLLKFRYEVGASTNILGWHLPVVFQFVQYEYDKQQNWRPHYEGKGQALSFRLSGEPGNVFVAGKRQVVNDYRFRSDQPQLDFLSYGWTNGTPPSTNEQQLKVLWQH
jgi:hypothetical protein